MKIAASFLNIKEPIVEEVNVCSKVSDLDLEMLEDLLEDAVENEDYELAVLLRDKINELKGREKGDV
jgi:protein-arginine kinase activator protein McsA